MCSEEELERDTEIMKHILSGASFTTKYERRRTKSALMNRSGINIRIVYHAGPKNVKVEVVQ